MKKVFALLLTLTMILSLVACGETETAEKNEEESSGTTQTTDTGLTEPVNLTLLSQGAGTDDYITLASEGKLLQENLPAGSTVTQETISSGCSSVGYLIEAGMGDFATGQNAMAATVGFEGKEPYSSVSALMATVKYAFVAELVTESFYEKTGCATLADVIEKKEACRIVAEPLDLPTMCPWCICWMSMVSPRRILKAGAAALPIPTAAPAATCSRTVRLI